MIYYILSSKSIIHTTGYMQFPCSARPRSTCKLYSRANCLGQFLNVPCRKQEIRLVSKYSLSSQTKTRILFPEPSVCSIRRTLELFARLKPSSENTVWVLASGFYALATTFRRSCHSLALTLSYFGIPVTMPYHTLSRQCLTIRPSKLYVQAHTFLPQLFFFSYVF